MKNPGRSRRAQESGSIFQRKDGRWCAQVLNPAPGPKGSRYLTRYAKTKAQAVEALNKLTASSAATPTFADDVYGTPSRIRKAQYAYELTGLNRGLRTGYQLFGPNPNAITTETYGYHPSLDVLTSAVYTGAGAGSGAWTYDAAGNRSNEGYAYDELNRMSSSPGFVYTHDTVGNRISKFSESEGFKQYFDWDGLNRLSGVRTGGNDPWSATYKYRADGLRVMKVVDVETERIDDDSSTKDQNFVVNDSTTSYYYDGQMGIAETYQYEVGRLIRTDTAENVVGPRGVEMQVTTVHNEPIRTSYPVYDGHRNMIAALSFNRPAMNASGVFPIPASYGLSIGGERLYDAWGGERAGQSHGYPNHRYCANLGHVSDDETSLIYMRARYYEPLTGRFVSEDPARDGWNWYVYAWNQPVRFVDPDGLAVMGLEPLLAAQEQLEEAADDIAVQNSVQKMHGVTGNQIVSQLVKHFQKLGLQGSKSEIDKLLRKAIEVYKNDIRGTGPQGARNFDLSVCKKSLFILDPTGKPIGTVRDLIFFMFL